MNSSQAAAYGNNYAYNPAKAISILKQAGFKRSCSTCTFTTPSGQPLSFTILNNGGVSHLVAARPTIPPSPKAIGIHVPPVNPAATTYHSHPHTPPYQPRAYPPT